MEKRKAELYEYGGSNRKGENVCGGRGAVTSGEGEDRTKDIV